MEWPPRDHPPSNWQDGSHLSSDVGCRAGAQAAGATPASRCPGGGFLLGQPCILGQGRPRVQPPSLPPRGWHWPESLSRCQPRTCTPANLSAEESHSHPAQLPLPLGAFLVTPHWGTHPLYAPRFGISSVEPNALGGRSGRSGTGAQGECSDLTSRALGFRPRTRSTGSFGASHVHTWPQFLYVQLCFKIRGTNIRQAQGLTIAHIF